MIKDKSPPFQAEYLVEQAERMLSYTLLLALAFSSCLFSSRTHTFMHMFMHTAITSLYVPVIMAEAIKSCRLKTTRLVVTVFCHAFVVLYFYLSIISLFLLIKETGFCPFHKQQCFTVFDSGRPNMNNGKIGLLKCI